MDYWDERHRVRVFSWVSGFFFALGWWIFIDAVTQNGYTRAPDALNVKAQLYLIGIGSTLAFVIVSVMDFSALSADEYTHHGGLMVRYQARALLGFAVAMSVACIIVALHVLVKVYIDKGGIHGQIPDDVYPGWAILWQTIFIFLSTVSMRFGVIG